MRLLAVLVLALGCNSQQDFHAARRVLDAFSYIDCGVVRPEDRQVCTVPLFSQGEGDVTIFDIRSEDISVPTGGSLEAGAFIVTPSDWQDAGCEDGTCRRLPKYDDSSDDDTLPLPITFAPQVEGYYQAELTIWSNDNVSEVEEPLPDDAERSERVWKVQLRGLARPPCSRVVPSFVDFGMKDQVGGEFHDYSARIENCGIVPLVVGGAGEQGSGAAAMTVAVSWPLLVLPGMQEPLDLAWTVGAETDDVPTPVEDVITFESNDPNMEYSPLTIVGNTCDESVSTDWDADADGWFYCGGDCDDEDSTRNPSQTERQGNGEDDDCDGTVDEAANPVSTDEDGDSWSENEGDCDDADAAISPDASETINRVDDDCDGYVDNETTAYDDDGDGYSELQGDCDDEDRLKSPDATEASNGFDDDCDGNVDDSTDLWDDDQDGFKEIDDSEATADCDDGDPWVYVGAFEYCDGYDNDCDRVIDEGEDNAENGACAFLPERSDEAGADASGEAAGGCVTAPGVTSALAFAATALAVFGRRSGRRAVVVGRGRG